MKTPADAAVRNWIDSGSDPDQWDTVRLSFLEKHPHGWLSLVRAWRDASRSRPEMPSRPPQPPDDFLALRRASRSRHV